MGYVAWFWEAAELQHHSSVFWSLFHLKVDAIVLNLKLLYSPIELFYQKTWKWKTNAEGKTLALPNSVETFSTCLILKHMVRHAGALGVRMYTRELTAHCLVPSNTPVRAVSTSQHVLLPAGTSAHGTHQSHRITERFGLEGTLKTLERETVY